MSEKNDKIALIKSELSNQVGNPETMKTLLQTIFFGVEQVNAQQALMEAYMRGFTLDDFLNKNLHVLTFKNKKTGKQNYSLACGINYCRKIGMRSGVCGKTAPEFKEDDKGNIISCTITVKRKVNEFIGDYSATVYLKEYKWDTPMWNSKPRTMLAKVAEMHALRMACPEELSQAYIEEEQEAEYKAVIEVEDTLEDSKTKMNTCKSLSELQDVWSDIPPQDKVKLEELKNNLKTNLCKSENMKTENNGLKQESKKSQEPGSKTL